VNPADTLGVDGDFYLNTHNCNLYNKNGGSWILVGNIRGLQGITGMPGASGSIWYNGTTVPTTSIGANGDFYLNTVNGDIYNRINNLWVLVGNMKGVQGDYGLPGKDGTIWHEGTSTPANTLGVDGDFYLNTFTCNIYTKNNGVWVQIGNIRGLQGATGPQGPQGEMGPQGIPGKDGTIWYTGTSTPANTLGLNGDFYFNSATSDIYRKNNEGLTGLTGTDGADGTIFHMGPTVPSINLGKAGDIYINIDTGEIYSRNETAWTIVMTINELVHDTIDQGTPWWITVPIACIAAILVAIYYLRRKASKNYY